MKKDETKKMKAEEVKEEVLEDLEEVEEVEEEESEDSAAEEEFKIQEIRVLEYGFMVPFTVDKVMKMFGTRRFDIPVKDGPARVIIDTKPNVALIGDGRFYAQFDFLGGRLMTILLTPAGATTSQEAKLYSEGILREAFGCVSFEHEMFRWFVVEDEEKPFGSDSTGMIRIELFPKLTDR